MSTDLSNREGQVLDYLKEVLKADFADADLRDDGPFMETFATPHIKLFEPLLLYIDRLKLMQSLDNANNMTIEEMDEVAFSHYMSRNAGERATGIATAVLDDFPASGTLVIPAGLEVTSKTGVAFRSRETVTLTESSLAAYYDAASFSYRIPLPMLAVSSGEEYNIEPGDITGLSRGVVPNLIDITNETPFTGGTNSETNAQLANRIIEARFSHNLGTKRGYVRYFKAYPEVKEVLTAGFKHPLMKRDVIGTVENKGIKFHENIRDVHWGTKIDAYVRGERPEEVVEYLPLVKGEDGYFSAALSSVPVLEIVEVRMHSLTGEYDDPNIDPASLYITDYVLVKEEDFETEGTIYEKSKIVVNDSRVTEGRYVRVTYRYNELISGIHTAMYEGDERSLTADVKIKEANKKFVFGAVVASMKSSIGMKESHRSLIRQRLKLWIDDLRMGEELQLSDLQDPIYETESENGEGVVDYIQLPYQFIVVENNSRYIYHCLSEKKRKMIESFSASNPSLYDVFEKYKDSVTTYDFFDILHSLTADSGFDENIVALQYRTGIVSSVASAFPRIRDMALNSRTSSRLSPPKKQVGENEYFALGESYIYDAKDYVESDWEQMLLLTWNIADQFSGDDDLNVVYRLAVYVLALVYIITTDGAEDDPSSVQRYVRKLVERTPIEFDFDI